VHPVAELLQGEVGLLGQELADLVVALRWDGRALATGVGAGLQGAGLLAQVQEVVDGVDGDAEEAGHLGGGADAAVDGIDDALAEFKGVGVHAGTHRRLVRRIGAAILIIGRQTDS
jgi:hypothetical protein